MAVVQYHLYQIEGSRHVLSFKANWSRDTCVIERRGPKSQDWATTHHLVMDTHAGPYTMHYLFADDLGYDDNELLVVDPTLPSDLLVLKDRALRSRQRELLHDERVANAERLMEAAVSLRDHLEGDEPDDEPDSILDEIEGALLDLRENYA